MGTELAVTLKAIPIYLLQRQTGFQVWPLRASLRDPFRAGRRLGALQEEWGLGQEHGPWVGLTRSLRPQAKLHNLWSPFPDLEIGAVATPPRVVVRSHRLIQVGSSK